MNEATEENGGTSNWVISLADIEGGTRVEHLVGDLDVLTRALPNETGQHGMTSSKVTGVSAILLLDRGIPFEDPSRQESDASPIPPPETGLVIFPPSQDDRIGAVTALQMAEGTFSCPKGMYLVYLSASAVREKISGENPDAREVLKQARDEVLKLASKSASEWKGDGVEVLSGTAESTKSLLPLMEIYYSTTEQLGKKERQGDHCWSALSTMSNIATSLDEATLQAEDLFWDIVGNEKRSEAEEARRKRKPVGYTVGRGLGGVIEGKESEGSIDFFTSEEAEMGGDDDE